MQKGALNCKLISPSFGGNCIVMMLGADGVHFDYVGCQNGFSALSELYKANVI